MKTILCLFALSLFAVSAHAATVLVEAESFQSPGGWVLDTQFIESMGSPYLMAHGLGEPVKDATTTVKLPQAGNWRVWVRTMDWVARWKAHGAPGKFQVLVDGAPLKETFGTKGADWAWHDGGTVNFAKPEATLALHDLTGFNGRCDAILLTTDPVFQPSNDSAPFALWRMELAGLPAKPEEAGAFDLVVVGGTIGAVLTMSLVFAMWTRSYDGYWFLPMVPSMVLIFAMSVAAIPLRAAVMAVGAAAAVTPGGAMPDRKSVV